MQYLKINGIDFSVYCNVFKVTKTVNYNAQLNASGDSVVDYINTKRSFEVGIIPVNQQSMIDLQSVIDSFNVKVSFLNPTTGLIEENVDCIIPTDTVEYYTIQANNISFKAFVIAITEL